ncbi:hypothetical protein [Cellulomonas soli]|uniref:DUF304 domain-containing protein n=1 Tax=Cellulomonas soli TaxID=931535 RepID=A0A512PGW4_9CELL|nr:hypothetical protein [Cellulomonas soli]NYI59629.1 hypothetical protein [Cellulomonas soli]GEP70423.1 hypothetical protein CSO01_31380 [Cellulomonas soli]
MSRVRTRASQTLAVVGWAALALACVGGMVDPEPPARAGWSPIGLVVAIISVVAAVRASRSGVIVTGSQVIVRNFLSTRRVSLADVEHVGVLNYDGFLVWDSPRTSWLCTVAVTTTAGRVVKAYGLVGFAASAERAAARLRDLIGLPHRSSAAAHRAP